MSVGEGGEEGEGAVLCSGEGEESLAREGTRGGGRGKRGRQLFVDGVAAACMSQIGARSLLTTSLTDSLQVSRS